MRRQIRTLADAQVPPLTSRYDVLELALLLLLHQPRFTFHVLRLIRRDQCSIRFDGISRINIELARSRLLLRRVTDVR